MIHVNETGYRAGDILTACDNELHVPTGYLGHSAIVVDGEHVVEAVITFPYVQLGRIDDFVRLHPKHAWYRPVRPQLGSAAAAYAVQYLRSSEANYAQGVLVPPFSFSPRIPLQDPWSSIYCSKLVWLSYFYGAGYPFYNDFFLFTPEDLDTVLSRDPNFQLLYKHPGFYFVIDT